jgi:hypothetical protein
MANVGMEDVVFYAKVGPENLKKLGVSTEAAVFQRISQDTSMGSGSSYSELLTVGNPSSRSGFPPWMVNEVIGSLSGKGFITTNPEEAYALDSAALASSVPASVAAANAAAVGTSSIGGVEQYAPPDILIPSGSRSSSSSSLSPEIAKAIGVDYQESIDSHAKRDSKDSGKKKKGNMMNLMDGLSTGRLIDSIGGNNDFGKSMENVGGNVGTMMDGLSLKMPSVPLDGREMKDAYEDEDEDK